MSKKGPVRKDNNGAIWANVLQKDVLELLYKSIR